MITSASFAARHALVFLDAFALTRVELPKKVKNVRNYSSAASGHLQQLADAVVVANAEVSAGSRLCSVPALSSTALRYISSDGYAFTADGEVAYRFDLARASDGGSVLFAYRFPIEELNERNIVQRKRFQLGEPLPCPASLAPVELAGSRPLYTRFQHLWPDGRFVAAGDGGLYCGQVAGERVTLRWHRPIRHGLDPLRLELRAEGDDVWIMGEVLGGGVATLARVDPEGEVTRWRFDALEAPGYHDGWVGLRTRKNRFVRFRLDQPDARERFDVAEELLELEGGAELDDLRKDAQPSPRVAADERGRVMMLSDQLLYLPWHGEHLLNPTASGAKDQVIPRKLPEAERELRSFYARLVARLRALAYEAGGSAQPARVWLKQGRVTLRVSSGAYDDDFAAACFAGVMRNSQAHHDVARFGQTGGYYAGPVCEWTHPATVEDVTRGLGLLARHGQSAIDLLIPIGEELKNGRAPAELFTDRARPLVAEAILAAALGEPQRDPPISRAADVAPRLEGRDLAFSPYGFGYDDPLAEILSALLA